MSKTKKSTILMILTAILCATVLMGIMYIIAPSRPARAEEETKAAVELEEKEETGYVPDSDSDKKGGATVEEKKEEFKDGLTVEEKGATEKEKVDEKEKPDNPRHLKINIVESFPTEETSFDGTKGTFSGYTYLKFLSRTALANVSEEDRTITVSNQKDLDYIAWDDGTYSRNPSSSTISHVYSDALLGSVAFDVVLIGITEIGSSLICDFNPDIFIFTGLLIPSDIVSINPSALLPFEFLDFYVSEGNENYCTENYYNEIGLNKSQGRFLLNKNSMALVRAGFSAGFSSLEIPNGVVSLLPNSCSFQSDYSSCHIRSIVIPDSVAIVSDYAIWGLDNLEEIEIGSRVGRIGAYGISDNNSLNTITIKAVIPPTLGAGAFSDCNDCEFFVPSSSLESYQAASGWSEFSARIQGYEPTLPEEPSGNGNSSETPSNNQPFDITAWAQNISNNISDWLGASMGISTTGTTVLIIGIVIIAVMLFKRRR